MKATEILNNVKALLHLSKEEVKVEDVFKEESVELSTKDVVDTIEEKKEVELSIKSEETNLADIPTVIVPQATSPSGSDGGTPVIPSVGSDIIAPVAAPLETPVNPYATKEEVGVLRAELIAMISVLIKDKASPEVLEVPQALSLQEEVELSEEVIHSPEEKIETKNNSLSNPNTPMTTEQRVNRMLFN